MATRTHSDGAQSGNGTGAETFEVQRPADGSVLTTLPADGPERVADAVARVRANQPDWERLGNSGRARWLYKLRDWLLDHQDEIADTMQAETGKVRGESGGETVYLADLINFYGKRAEKFIGDEQVPAHSPLMKTKKLRVKYRPYPVVGVISPWNFPLILSLGDALPGAAGRRRRGDQALGGHPARNRRDRRGLEARHRRPRRARRRQRRRRDRLRPGGRGRLRAVHGL